MRSKKQRDFRDCGITCLAYIIEYYNGYVPLETLRIDTFTNQNGVSAYHLVKTLEKYGFQAYGKKIKYEDIDNIVKPCILHLTLENGLEHFVVLLKVKKDYVYIMDPAFGNRKVSKREFLSMWHGVVLEAIPLKVIVKMPKERNILAFIKTWLKENKVKVLLIVLAEFVGIMFHILLSYYVNLSMFMSFRLLFMGLIVIFIWQLVFSFIEGFVRIKLEKNITIKSLKNFIMHMYRIPLENFFSYTSGELLTRIEEVKELKGVLSGIVIPLLIEAICSLFSFILILFIDKKMGLLLIIGMIIYFVISIVEGKKIYEILMKVIDEEISWKENMIENVDILPTMKYLDSYSYYEHNVFKEIERNTLIKEKEEKRMFLLTWIRNNYLEVLFFLLMTFGIIAIKKGTMDSFNFIIFQSLYIYLITPLRDFADIIPRWYYFKMIMEKTHDFLSIKKEKMDGIKDVLEGSISFKKVSYSYQNVYPVLKNVSFKIGALEHVLVCGKSGVGKSTICKLLVNSLGKYDGEILIGGVSLEKYDSESLRKNVTYLSQKEKVITGTIRNNIEFGRSISKEVFDNVCRICHVDEIVRGKKFGYDTVINKEVISGGERQRIVLARTILSNSKIMLLDECLSEVDNKTSLDIIDGLHRFLKDKTVLFISHQNIDFKLDRTIEISMKGGEVNAQ